MEPDYRFRSYKEYLPERFQSLFNEYWTDEEHSMKELVEFIYKIYKTSSTDESNYANVAEALYACCEFFFYGGYGGMDPPGNTETDVYLTRYREGIEKISVTLQKIMQVANGTQSEMELRDINQLWKYLGWKIVDQQKIIN